MIEFASITKVEISATKLTAYIELSPEAPLFTSMDLEATTRVYNIMPGIIDHACLGDAAETFKDVMGDTELCHLLEHIVVEILAQTDRAGDISAGKTFVDQEDDRHFTLEFECVDDVLTSAALSSGVWILNWAFAHPEGASPSLSAIVSGIVALVDSLAPAAASASEEAPSDESLAETVASDEAEAEEAEAERAEGLDAGDASEASTSEDARESARAKEFDDLHARADAADVDAVRAADDAADSSDEDGHSAEDLPAISEDAAHDGKNDAAAPAPKAVSRPQAPHADTSKAASADDSQVFQMPRSKRVRL